MPITSTGSRRGLHRLRQARDDVRRMAGRRGLRDALDRPPARAGVVLGDDHQQRRDDETDERAESRACPRSRAGPGISSTIQCMTGMKASAEMRRGDDDALVERTHDAAAAAHAHELRADDRGDDRDAAEHERDRDPGAAPAGLLREQHAGHERHRVGLEEVGRHAGVVADVVADVVGDHGRVARIVLGDARLDLADEVGADVGALREDAAAEAREDRDQRAAEGEADERAHGVGLGDVAQAQGAVVAGDAEQAEADDEDARHGAALEGDVEGLARGRCGPPRRRARWRAPPCSCRRSRRAPRARRR